MNKKILDLRMELIKHKPRIRQYQLAGYLGIPEYVLSKMLNDLVPMSDEIYQKAMAYLEAA